MNKNENSRLAGPQSETETQTHNTTLARPKTLDPRSRSIGVGRWTLDSNPCRDPHVPINPPSTIQPPASSCAYPSPSAASPPLIHKSTNPRIHVVGRYALRKGRGFWLLTFDDQDAVFKNERGAYYIHYLLKNPPAEPIHGLALNLAVNAFASQPGGILQVEDPVTGARSIVTACARIQEQSPAIEEAESAAALRRKQLELEASGELRELISEFGVVRRKMMPYPIGMGTARPARMGTRPSFGSIAMSAAITEKSPTVTFASLESHKIGGIVRLPREIDEQSVVAMGRFLARYGAIEFARAEDTWGFLADGSGTYENVKGIVQVARDSAKTWPLGSGKTKPSDANLADFRGLRTKISKAALNGRLSAYYLDSTWETQLPTFKTAAEQNVYQRLPDGTAILDGYPVIWTDVFQPFSTTASADTPIAVFGALSFWWMGEHGHPRIDTTEHVYFANDQLAVRFIEEIDFDYAASDATAVLLTAAS